MDTIENLKAILVHLFGTQNEATSSHLISQILMLKRCNFTIKEASKWYQIRWAKKKYKVQRN